MIISVKNKVEKKLQKVVVFIHKVVYSLFSNNKQDREMNRIKLQKVSKTAFKMAVVQAKTNVSRLCEVTGVHRSSISKWINGHAGIGVDTYNKLVDGINQIEEENSKD